MMERRRIFLTAFAAILVLAVASPMQAKGTAPDFNLSNLEGKDVVLSDLLEEGPVIVDFWATWCKPCLKAFPGLQEILDRYKDRGLTVVAVSVDSPRSRAYVGPLIKSKKYTFEVVLDTEGRVAKKYNAFLLPRTVLVNREGEVVFTATGYRPSNHEKIEKILASILPEEPVKDGMPVE
jgi:cytochrome c biogenesis protein CcmG/thiol:disulfide interchange protein DsbE